MTSSIQPESGSQGAIAQAYDSLVQSGRLNADAGQEGIIRRFQALAGGLEQGQNRGMIGKWLARRRIETKNIYLWGDVGRGKSMLMDLFYHHVDVPKRRIHFHAFMQDVHARMHHARKSQEADGRGGDLLQIVAQELAAWCGTLLCLDELQVTDVADAMILSRLFEALLGRGVTFVITSNRPPSELYLGGLQREKFLEFVELVTVKMEIIRLESPHDYRMRQIRALQTVYLTPATPEHELKLDAIFSSLLHHAKPEAMALEVSGRSVPVAKSGGGVASFTFQELCAQPLGAGDYLAVARHFHTICLHRIPRMGPNNRNEARRFVTLIDTLYDTRVKLICTADAPPEQLYPAGDGSFEFHRTVSRLAEMQSESYLAQQHLK
jgi:cell division protein ZapE